MAHDVTERLAAIRQGDRGAMQDVFQLVYRELRDLAGRELARRPNPSTLSSTTLVHEAYLKLVDRTRADWKDRHHFFAVAAKAMRQILVDHVRHKLADKRGAGARHVPLSETQIGVEDRLVEVLALDEALGQLEKLSERLGQVVELRFFGGLSVEEAAEVLGVTPRTVKRDWRKARALLFHHLNQEAETGLA
jgi:RNA polymerase sigma factor (TIGR02999 family)